MFKHAVAHMTCILVLLLTVGAQIAARAQGQNGEIRGTVTDPTGALIPAAQVVLNGADGSTKSVTAGRDGSFQIVPVQPGTYTLVINAAGFAPAIDSVQVAPGKSVQEKITLQLPVEEQQVQV